MSITLVDVVRLKENTFAWKCNNLKIDERPQKSYKYFYRKNLKRIQSIYTAHETITFVILFVESVRTER